MAEQNQDPNSPTPNDDVIDLEGLVRNIDEPASATPSSPSVSSPSGTAATPVSAPPSATVTDTSAGTASSKAVPHEKIHDEELSGESLDELLAIEDPEMAAQMASIREVGFAKTTEDISSVEQDEAALLAGQTNLAFKERLQLRMLRMRARMSVFKRLGRRAMTDSKGVLRELAIRSKVAIIASLRNRKANLAGGFAWFKSRTLAQKGALFLVVVIVSGLLFVSLKTLKGTLLPKTEKLWIASFADHADGVFKYDPDGAFEDFNDPLLHPEFVILIERVVVNLARTPEASANANPMAAFELYLQTENQEASVEIKDRSVEIRDAIARSVERMTYPDLVGEEGKAKLKLLIRKDLNEIMTKGKVRRVYFKTIVLNPE